MDDSIKVKEIVLQIRDVEIKLSPSEAQKLLRELQSVLKRDPDVFMRNLEIKEYYDDRSKDERDGSPYKPFWRITLPGEGPMYKVGE